MSLNQLQSIQLSSSITNIHTSSSFNQLLYNNTHDSSIRIISFYPLFLNKLPSLTFSIFSIENNKKIILSNGNFLQNETFPLLFIPKNLNFQLKISSNEGVIAKGSFEMKKIYLEKESNSISHDVLILKLTDVGRKIMKEVCMSSGKGIDYNKMYGMIYDVKVNIEIYYKYKEEAHESKQCLSRNKTSSCIKKTNFKSNSKNFNKNNNKEVKESIENKQLTILLPNQNTTSVLFNLNSETETLIDSLNLLVSNNNKEVFKVKEVLLLLQSEISSYNKKFLEYVQENLMKIKENSNFLLVSNCKVKELLHKSDRIYKKNQEQVIKINKIKRKQRVVEDNSNEKPTSLTFLIDSSLKSMNFLGKSYFSKEAIGDLPLKSCFLKNIFKKILFLNGFKQRKDIDELILKLTEKEGLLVDYTIRNFIYDNQNQDEEEKEEENKY